MSWSRADPFLIPLGIMELSGATARGGRFSSFAEWSGTVGTSFSIFSLSDFLYQRMNRENPGPWRRCAIRRSESHTETWRSFYLCFVKHFVVVHTSKTSDLGHGVRAPFFCVSVQLGANAHGTNRFFKYVTEKLLSFGKVTGRRDGKPPTPIENRSVNNHSCKFHASEHENHKATYLNDGAEHGRIIISRAIISTTARASLLPPLPVAPNARCTGRGQVVCRSTNTPPAAPSLVTDRSLRCPLRSIRHQLTSALARVRPDVSHVTRNVTLSLPPPCLQGGTGAVQRLYPQVAFGTSCRRAGGAFVSWIF
ncbi:unnamed protein product [Ectocarpus sp. 8 AP-2014]